MAMEWNGNIRVEGSYDRGYTMPDWRPGTKAVVLWKATDDDSLYEKVCDTVTSTLHLLGAVNLYVNIELVSAGLVHPEMEG